MSDRPPTPPCVRFRTRRFNRISAETRIGGLHRPLLRSPVCQYSALPHTLRVPHYPFAGSPRFRGILLSTYWPPSSVSSDLRLFGPSLLFFEVLWPLLTSHSSLLLRSLSNTSTRSPPVRPPRVLTRSFTLIPAMFTSSDSVQLLGFGSPCSLTLARGLT